MVKLKGFEFSLIEFAGALGDFGSLNPFIIAYIAILSLNPTGVLLAIGLTNIVIGLIYKLLLPVEPQKAVATVALNDRWSPSIIFGTGIGLGLIWLILVAARLIRKIAKITPISVIVGIRLGLMLILLREPIELIAADILLALIAFILVLLLIKNKKLPAGIAIFLLGLAIVFLSNPNLDLKFRPYLPQFFPPSFQDMYVSLLTVGVAQLALTLSNAILGTCLLVNEKFPSWKMKEENLATNMGWMNAIFPFSRRGSYVSWCRRFCLAIFLWSKNRRCYADERHY